MLPRLATGSGARMGAVSMWSRLIRIPCFCLTSNVIPWRRSRSGGHQLMCVFVYKWWYGRTGAVWHEECRNTFKWHPCVLNFADFSTLAPNLISSPCDAITHVERKAKSHATTYIHFFGGFQTVQKPLNALECLSRPILVPSHKTINLPRHSFRLSVCACVRLWLFEQITTTHFTAFITSHRRQLNQSKKL